MWAGAQSLMNKPTTQKEATERKLIVLVSKALGINPLGVNVLGSLPYTNNQGRKEKLSEYAPGAMFEYNWVQRALDDEQKAICEARIVDKDGKNLCNFVVGECSRATIKMTTLLGYSNHLAQTRAENRAFEAAFGARFRKELFEGIARELKVGLTTPRLAEAAQAAGNTSAEEAVNLTPKQKNQGTESYMRGLQAIANMKDVPNLEKSKEQIKKAKLYSAEQRDQLLRMIDAKIATLKGE